MMKTDLATSSVSKVLNGFFQTSGAPRITGNSSNSEIRARFLQTSARYLGIDVDKRELESRYMPG